MKVVAFCGSPRKKGNTRQALEMVCEVLESEGISTSIIQIGGKKIHGCIACYKCGKEKDGRCHGHKDDKLNEYIEAMRKADGILIGSPTYFSNVSPEVKALIDRAGLVARMNGSFFKRKVGAAVVVARRCGASHVFSSINYFFLISEMIVPGSSYWNMGLALKPGEIQKDEEAVKTFKDLGTNMAWLLKKINK
ncbi:MAG TPA: flavodoxin family protein [Deltaproteobacteria bacterium]|nr:MAG: flavodoxin family protein [Deltaproteobacteria bacterium]RLB10062.1 MAG: flavodoxin family protein [Deltaproteobacteria bacterium]HDM75557.1 flavodoxin family protein [Deltaproteobacteria bacterium]